MTLLIMIFNKIIKPNPKENIKLILIMKNDWHMIQIATGLPADALQALDDCGWQVAYRAGGPVLWEGDACTALFFVQSGAVEIYRTALDGHEHTLGIILPGRGFNLVPVLREKGENPASARCVKASALLALSREDVHRIMQRYPQVAIALAQEMAFRLESMADKAGALALHSVRQRLAAFLIAEADKAESGSGISWTRDEMARQVGTVRDVIGRNLRGLEEEGIIRRKKGDILLLDKEGLLRIARGGDAT